MPLTRSQIDKLGTRLKSADSPSDADLRLLARYQAALDPLRVQAMFRIADAFVEALPDARFEVTIREKQVRSVVAKLRRQSTRLSSMQDLVGFRVVVPGIQEQEALLSMEQDLRQLLELVISDLALL